MGERYEERRCVRCWLARVQVTKMIWDPETLVLVLKRPRPGHRGIWGIFGPTKLTTCIQCHVSQTRQPSLGACTPCIQPWMRTIDNHLFRLPRYVTDASVSLGILKKFFLMSFATEPALSKFAFDFKSFEIICNGDSLWDHNILSNTSNTCNFSKMLASLQKDPTASLYYADSPLLKHIAYTALLHSDVIQLLKLY